MEKTQGICPSENPTSASMIKGLLAAAPVGSSISPAQSIEPPNAPWLPLKIDPEGDAQIVSFYSEDLSKLPVRRISDFDDPKADPNLETGTYGLLSTCHRDQRKGIVNGSSGVMFFFTNWRGKRHVVGYYELGWYCSGARNPNDIRLAASRMHFVARPLLLNSVPLGLRGNYERKRTLESISSTASARLRAELDKQSDATADYLSEVDRTETLMLRRYGYRDVKRKQTMKYSWELARLTCDPRNDLSEAKDSKTASPTGYWECTNCAELAPTYKLRSCPKCHSQGTWRVACVDAQHVQV